MSWEKPSLVPPLNILLGSLVKDGVINLGMRQVRLNSVFSPHQSGGLRLAPELSLGFLACTGGTVLKTRWKKQVKRAGQTANHPNTGCFLWCRKDPLAERATPSRGGALQSDSSK